MRLVDAVYARIMELAEEKEMNVNAFANMCGIPRSTIVTMPRSKTAKLSTIYGVCEGVNITLQEFFNSPIFSRENIVD
ncbi:MAG: transcriptional regulator [Clostridia bacterium]|nr:transcriptional regulator [Clostridia bacterium]